MVPQKVGKVRLISLNSKQLIYCRCTLLCHCQTPPVTCFLKHLHRSYLRKDMFLKFAFTHFPPANGFWSAMPLLPCILWLLVFLWKNPTMNTNHNIMFLLKINATRFSDSRCILLPTINSLLESTQSELNNNKIQVKRIMKLCFLHVSWSVFCHGSKLPLLSPAERSWQHWIDVPSYFCMVVYFFPCSRERKPLKEIG